MLNNQIRNEEENLSQLAQLLTEEVSINMEAHKMMSDVSHDVMIAKAKYLDNLYTIRLDFERKLEARGYI